jgi:hypothetical protein
MRPRITRVLEQHPNRSPQDQERICLVHRTASTSGERIVTPLADSGAVVGVDAAEGTAVPAITKRRIITNRLLDRLRATVPSR